MIGFKKYVLFGLAPVLFVLLVYSNSFQNSFQYDDVHSIVRNPHIKNPENLPKFFWSPKMGSGLVPETSAYRPLLMVSLGLNYFLGVLDPFGYHLVNLLIHMVCALFVFLITLNLLRITNVGKESEDNRNGFTALFAALIFAAHPVQTESVTYIMGRSSSLTALFFLAAVWAYIRYSVAGKIRYTFLALFFYACSLLVKETAITLPLVLILFDLFFPLHRSWKGRLAGILPFIALSALYLGFRSYFLGGGQFSTTAVRPLYDHLLTQPRAWVHYLETLLAPINLNIDYDFPPSHSLLEPRVLLSIGILAAVSVCIWKVSKYQRMVGFLALWFAVNLLPTNSLIPLEDVVTDRWLYLSSVGYAITLALAGRWIFLARVKTGGRAGNLIFFFLCALVLELYGAATLLRNITWTNDWMLWEDAVRKSPLKDRSHHGLAEALYNAGQYEEAIKSFRNVLVINPKHPGAYLNLGNIYLMQGKLSEAAEAFQKAKSLSPRMFAADAYNNLGVVYKRQGRLQEAIEEFHKSIAVRPWNDAAYVNLGDVYVKMEDLDQAISCMEKAVQITPEQYRGYYALYRLYNRKGWKEKSEEAHKKFLAYYPVKSMLPARQVSK